MRTLFSLAALLFSLEARAATPPDFDLAAWKTLADRAVAGTLSSQDAFGREYRSLARFTNPDPAVSRVADYVSVVGNTQSDGTFHRDHLEIVTEAWVIEPDNVKSVEQWAWVVGLDGNVTFVLHQRITEELDGTLLDDQRLDPPALTDSAMLRQVGDKIAEWERAQ